MITAICGENGAERLAERSRLVRAFVAEYTDMGLEQFDASEVAYDRIVEAVQSVPFLAGRKMVVIHGGSLNTEFVEKFADFVQNIPESTDVLLSEAQLDKRTSYYKLLQKLTDFHEYKELDAAGLARWAVDYARAEGGELKLADAQYLIARVGDAAHAGKKTGADQLLLRHEIDKLLTYRPSIDRKSIDLLTDEAPQSKIFDLLDAAFAGQAARAQKLYTDQRAQGVEPQQIVAMLSWQLYGIALCKAGQRYGSAEIAHQASMSLYAVEKMIGVAKQIDVETVKRMVTELRVLDIRSKRENIDLDTALQHYLLAFH